MTVSTFEVFRLPVSLDIFINKTLLMGEQQTLANGDAILLLYHFVAGYADLFETLLPFRWPDFLKIITKHDLTFRIKINEQGNF